MQLVSVKKYLGDNVNAYYVFLVDDNFKIIQQKKLGSCCRFWPNFNFDLFIGEFADFQKSIYEYFDNLKGS